MAARAIKIGFWFLGTLFVLVVGVILLALTSAVQTRAVKHLLKTVNESIAGRIDVERVSVGLGGRLGLWGIQIKDADGHDVVTLDSLIARVKINALLHDSIHVRDLHAAALTADIEIDSAGQSNLLRALAPQDTTTKPKATTATVWVIRIDTAVVIGKDLNLTQPEIHPIAWPQWQVGLRGGYGHDSANYALRFDVPQTLIFTTAGNVALRDSAVTAGGVMSMHLDSGFANWLPKPADKIGILDAQSDYALTADSLLARANLKSSTLGSLTMQAAMPFPYEPLSGHAIIALDSLRPAILWDDSNKVLINGSLEITKAATKDALDGWTAQIALNDCRYGNYRVVNAEVSAAIHDSIIDANGFADTGHGRLAFQAAMHGREPKTAQIDADATLTALDLRRFVPGIPDTLEPISGYVAFRATGLEPGTMTAGIRARLDTVRLGSYEAAALIVRGEMIRDSIALDTLAMTLAGGNVAASAHGKLGDRLEFSATLNWPDLNTLRPLLGPMIPAQDTIGGALTASLSGSASLKDTLPSHVMVAGDAQLSNARYAHVRVKSGRLMLEELNADSLNGRGMLIIDSVRFGDQPLDTLVLNFDGSANELAYHARLSARGDTLRLSMQGILRRNPESMDVTVDTMQASAYGVTWYSDGSTTISIQEHHVELDALTIRSPVGVLRASGYYEPAGNLDVVAELSGVSTGEIARTFKQKIPESSTSIRLQVVGVDSVLTGDLTMTSDSVVLDGMRLADRIDVSAQIDGHHLVGAGNVIWFGDTLTEFAAEIPATISLANGFVLADTLPINGHVRLLEQPLEKANGYLPFGMSAAGFVSGECTLSGTPRAPQTSGSFQVRDGKYQDSRIGVNYSDINLHGDFNRDSLRISNLTMKSIGKLTGHGYLVAEQGKPLRLNLDMDFDRFEAVHSPQMRVRATGELSVEGPLRQLHARGRVKTNEVLYRITQTTSKTIEPIDLPAELAILRGDTAKPVNLLEQLYRPMSHELAVDIPGNCWMRGGGLNIEVAGTLWLYKISGADPIVNGEIQVRDGRVSFVGKELRVSEGVVRYNGSLNNPELDIRAYSPQHLPDTLGVHLTGTLSETRMEPLVGTIDQVVLALFVGKGSSGVGGGSATAQAEQALTSGATSQLSSLVGRMSGLDVFEYKTGEGGVNNLSSGSLEVGTYVTERLFVKVIQPIEVTQTGQNVSVEYRLLDWLKLRAQQTGGEHSAVDVFMQIDWR